MFKFGGNVKPLMSGEINSHNPVKIVKVDLSKDTESSQDVSLT